jgi:hypothetical protein
VVFAVLDPLEPAAAAVRPGHAVARSRQSGHCYFRPRPHPARTRNPRAESRVSPLLALNRARPAGREGLSLLNLDIQTDPVAPPSAPECVAPAGRARGEERGGSLLGSTGVGAPGAGGSGPALPGRPDVDIYARCCIVC